MIRGDENNLSYTGKGLQFTMVFMFFIVHCLQSRMAYFQLSKITIQFQRPLIKKGCCIKVGNGKRTSFWTDCWVQGQSFQNLYIS